ncbi:MAG: UDP-N-acetylglucosamine--N-acetylmuramyl-(pentapeptide) pyrophosphoryl-undecaprenol N-acetylglucosamine transferase [Gemmatimonadota bacterium]
MTPGAGTFYIAGGGTGGHLYPGLAIADALVSHRPDLDIMFIGARRGIEATVLPTTRWRHQLLDLHPLYRSAPWQNWKTVVGLRSAFKSIGLLTAQSRALGVLGTGGYAAGALLGYARLHSLPYFLQEQNAVAGLTVKFFSSRARHTFVGFPEAIGTLPAGGRQAALVTGNPITPPPTPLPDRGQSRAAWGFPAAVRRVLLVFGGSQGSRAINDAVASWLPTHLPPDWGAIWVTGRGEHARHAHLASDRVRVIAYQQPMAQAYATVDLAVARAGAMSTAELCAWGIPMVLVPLPTAAADHQVQNARALAQVDAARLVMQDTLASGGLASTLSALCTDPSVLDGMAESARARARVDAAQVIAGNILGSLNLK